MNLYFYSETGKKKCSFCEKKSKLLFKSIEKNVVSSDLWKPNIVWRSAELKHVISEKSMKALEAEMKCDVFRKKAPSSWMLTL